MLVEGAWSSHDGVNWVAEASELGLRPGEGPRNSVVRLPSDAHPRFLAHVQWIAQVGKWVSVRTPSIEDTEQAIIQDRFVIPSMQFTIFND